MDISNNIFLLREVLAYDSFVGSPLTLFDRVLIHQHIAKGSGLKSNLLNKTQCIANIIKQERWEAPEFQYTEKKETAEIILQVYNTDTERWETFKQSNNNF